MLYTLPALDELFEAIPAAQIKRLSSNQVNDLIDISDAENIPEFIKDLTEVSHCHVIGMLRLFPGSGVLFPDELLFPPLDLVAPPISDGDGDNYDEDVVVGLLVMIFQIIRTYNCMQIHCIFIFPRSRMTTTKYCRRRILKV